MQGENIVLLQFFSKMPYGRNGFYVLKSCFIWEIEVLYKKQLFYE